LEGADFLGAELKGANFTGATISGASFKDAKNVNTHGASLSDD